MSALLDIVLPVFLVVGFGYVVTWRKWLAPAAVDGIMVFAQSFAIPCLLFVAIARLDLGATFDPWLLGSFYSGATAGFLAGLFGARFFFGRPWEDSVAIGFATFFSNSVLMGLPLTERAYGADALGPNFAIIAIHVPYCYILGFIVMEGVRTRGEGLSAALRAITRATTRNPLMIGIALGFVVNLTGAPLPAPIWDAADLMARAGLPAALFALGGILYRYRPEGDGPTIAYMCAVSLVLHPVLVWLMGRGVGLSTEQFRSAVLTAAMAPGVNAYIFANMYGVARRVVATTVLVGTALCVVSAGIWLTLLP
jgi:predicted permease